MKWRTICKVRHPEERECVYVFESVETASSKPVALTPQSGWFCMIPAIRAASIAEPRKLCRCKQWICLIWFDWHLYGRHRQGWSEPTLFSKGQARLREMEVEEAEAWKMITQNKTDLIQSLNPRLLLYCNMSLSEKHCFPKEVWTFTVRYFFTIRSIF